MSVIDYYKSQVVPSWKKAYRAAVTHDERLYCIRNACYTHQRLQYLEGKAPKPVPHNVMGPPASDLSSAAARSIHRRSRYRGSGSVKTRKRWGVYTQEHQELDRANRLWHSRNRETND